LSIPECSVRILLL
jgi:uncharacterized tellurite resistance protein B-like protein